MVSHQDYYQKSRCTVSNCNFQFVSQFLSNDHDVASECKNSEEEKIKYPQNLSLYHTVDIAGGSFVRILSKPE